MKEREGMLHPSPHFCLCNSSFGLSTEVHIVKETSGMSKEQWFREYERLINNGHPHGDATAELARQRQQRIEDFTDDVFTPTSPTEDDQPRTKRPLP